MEGICLPYSLSAPFFRYGQLETHNKRFKVRPPALTSTITISGCAPPRVALQPPTSLETPATEDGGLLGDVLPDAGLLPLDEEAERGVLRARVREALAGLADERARLVVALHVGLEGQRAHTLSEIGERLGLTRERVRQIEGAALAVLRAGALRAERAQDDGDDSDVA